MHYGLRVVICLSGPFLTSIFNCGVPGFVRTEKSEVEAKKRRLDKKVIPFLQ